MPRRVLPPGRLKAGRVAESGSGAGGRVSVKAAHVWESNPEKEVSKVRRGAG